MSSLFPPLAHAPLLPVFDSLLITGSFHPTAPIHLCLSHLSRGQDLEAIIITPSRQAIIQALQEYHDDWLTANSGTGRYTDVSSRVKVLSVFYGPASLYTQLNSPYQPPTIACTSMPSSVNVQDLPIV